MISGLNVALCGILGRGRMSAPTAHAVFNSVAAACIASVCRSFLCCWLLFIVFSMSTNRVFNFDSNFLIALRTDGSKTEVIMSFSHRFSASTTIRLVSRTLSGASPVVLGSGGGGGDDGDGDGDGDGRLCEDEAGGGVALLSPPLLSNNIFIVCCIEIIWVSTNDTRSSNADACCTQVLNDVCMPCNSTASLGG